MTQPTQEATDFSLLAWLPLALAHGAVLAGMLASRILHLGAKLPEFKAEIILMMFFVQFLVFGPLRARVRWQVAAGRCGAH